MLTQASEMQQTTTISSNLIQPEPDNNPWGLVKSIQQRSYLSQLGSCKNRPTDLQNMGQNIFDQLLMPWLRAGAVVYMICGKTDPPEIERTYNIRKQQTRFYWVCLWELMESATILTPPSTGLRSILLSIRTQYSWRTRIWKNINTTAWW